MTTFLTRVAEAERLQDKGAAIDALDELEREANDAVQAALAVLARAEHDRDAALEAGIRIRRAWAAESEVLRRKEASESEARRRKEAGK